MGMALNDRGMDSSTWEGDTEFNFGLVVLSWLWISHVGISGRKLEM